MANRSQRHATYMFLKEPESLLFLRNCWNGGVARVGVWVVVDRGIGLDDKLNWVTSSIVWTSCLVVVTPEQVVLSTVRVAWTSQKARIVTESQLLQVDTKAMCGVGRRVGGGQSEGLWVNMNIGGGSDTLSDVFVGRVDTSRKVQHVTFRCSHSSEKGLFVTIENEVFSICL